MQIAGEPKTGAGAGSPGWQPLASDLEEFSIARRPPRAPSDWIQSDGIARTLGSAHGLQSCRDSFIFHVCLLALVHPGGPPDTRRQDHHHEVDLLVIGAGPVGMAVVTKLLETNDSSVSDAEHARSVPGKLDASHSEHSSAALALARVSLRSRQQVSAPRIVVVDPNNAWMSQWKRLFAGLSITHLRSTVTAHPCPFDAESLRRFAFENNRMDEIRATVLEDSLVSSVMSVDASIFDETPSAGKAPSVTAKTSKKQRAKQAGFGSVQFSEADRNDFVLPGSKLFVDFCDSLVEKYRLNDLLVQGWVSDIQPVFAECPVLMPCEESSVECEHNVQPGRERRPERFLVTLSDGRQYNAKAVVAAVGITNLPNVPAWIHSAEGEYPEHALGHAWDLANQLGAQEPLWKGGAEACSSQPGCPKHTDFAECGDSDLGAPSAAPTLAASPPAAKSKPRHLLVVGGGLTSAQLCHKALEQARLESRELRVTLAIRKKYVAVKQFDVDLAWFGRCKNLYSCKFLQLQSMQRRLQVVQQARQGGSISPEAMAQLQTWIDSGHLEIRTGIDFKGASWNASFNHWQVVFHAASSRDQSATADEPAQTMQCNRIWLATGSHLDIRRETSFRTLTANMQYTPPLVGSGIPELQPDLRWLPGWNLFLAGAYAQLQIGPNAGNLFGARLAAGRLRDELVQFFKAEPKTEASTTRGPETGEVNQALDVNETSAEDLRSKSASDKQRGASRYKATVRNTGNWFSVLQDDEVDEDDAD